MSRANEENNELDDLFTTSDDSNDGDIFATLNGSQDDAAEADPFANFGDAPSDDAAAAAPLTDDDKKGKKGKKAKKEKAPKAPKAKKEKAPKSDVMYGSPKPFVVLGAVFLLLILVANAVAFMTAGANAIMFLVIFDLLGLLLLAIPALLIKQLRTRAVGLFDVFIALAAAFVLMAAMAMLAQQAKNYGASSKVASNVAVSSFDVRA